MALNQLKKSVETYAQLEAQVGDLDAYFELIKEEGEDESLVQELKTMLESFESTIETLEIQAYLSGKYDAYPAFFSLNAGAGGTDAQDWAEMLLRMYLRWFEKKGFTAEIIELTPGDEAGLKSVTVSVTGDFAYGLCKTEVGVHRLVRLSPFNANSKRQTSFAAVDVIPDLSAENLEVTLDPKDLKIDTFRASGAGGQHINKTDSAVRVTHLPTGLVATCQNSRSQGANKEKALQILTSRLVALMEQEKKSHIEELRGHSTDIAWGNQIRSYVFHPYKLVKDLRTDVETSNLQHVMDGDLDPFVTAKLKMT